MAHAVSASIRKYPPHLRRSESRTARTSTYATYSSFFSTKPCPDSAAEYVYPCDRRNQMIFTLRLSQRAATIAIAFASLCLAQKDPGVRGGPPGAGGPIAGLKVNELALFTEGKARTVQLESVCDTCNDVTLGSDPGQDPNLVTLTNSSGLGARFNADQCSVCHQQPAIGGSGGFLVPNPQDPVALRRAPENP